MATTAFTSIDFERPGKQVGVVNLPHSPHGDAWGVIAVPIAVIAGGAGPTVLISGGVHGDEYEGPIVINELIRGLEPEDVNGRLILLPCANTPAVRAAMRTSPFDLKNMARVFPGDDFGSPTEQLAAYIHDVLFPRADVYVDLHAGGGSLVIEKSVHVVVTDGMDPEVRDRSLALARAFGAPVTVVTTNMGDSRTSCGAAAKRGLPSIAAEMGIAGWTSPDGVAMTRDGVRRVLASLGVLQGDGGAAPATRLVRISGPQAYLFAPGDGVFEPFFRLGDHVAEGQSAGRLHQLTRPALEPETLRFPSGGTVYAHRTFGRVAEGNGLAVLVVDAGT